MEPDEHRQRALAAIWCATGLTVVFSAIRLYVRLFMIKAYGSDDHVYMLALLPLLIATSLLTFSTSYNWGTAGADSNPIDTRPPPFPGMASPQLLGVVGQGILVLGSALAKCSVGMFQLRFVTVRWQRASIYAWIIAVLGLSITVNIAQYTSCKPAAYFWDTTITEGECAIDFLKLFMWLAVLWVVVDFYWAILPWIFVRHLNMPHKEKVIVLSSMSLGLLAMGIGISRVAGLVYLDPNGDSNSDLVPLILDTWEYAITMVGVCIPVCNPLWISWARKLFWTRSRKNRDYHRHRANRSWWWRRWIDRRRRRQSLNDEPIFDGSCGGGGVRVQIGGPGGRVIRFKGGGGVVGVGAGLGAGTFGEQQNQQTSLGGPVYATHTIGGSDMTKSVGVGEHRSTSSGTNHNRAARESRDTVTESGATFDTPYADKDEPGQQQHHQQEQRQHRWSATAWIKQKTAKIVLGNEEQQVSEIELRGDAFDIDSAHSYVSRGSQASRGGRAKVRDVEAGSSIEPEQPNKDRGGEREN
ncbi:hypothetical protein Micbo1qcDRAFT_207716 [Microdochium bolleyi]|uniref:Rhodopsin domain-containing protein n=1 Tax=Microdochium bolleyi TaxID=196109 RepID=A0A136ISY2_9PEZI|nr:hypothetical protein Micbo1qcDRAFT_207716 [Microdochium bolleyi]